jgi:putative oxidoreductase
MKRAGKIARLTLGLLLIIFGIHGFTGFMGERIVPYEAGMALQCLDSLGFLFPMLSLLAVLTGTLLVANLFVPIAVTTAIVMIIGVIVFHLKFYPGGIMFAAIGFVAAVVVVWDSSGTFRMVMHRAEENEDQQ